MNAEILIIGAGPAGLACAMELARKGRPAFVVERDAQVGGLAKTLTFKEGEDVFLTDIGPHRFFSKNKYLYDFIEDLLHEEWRKVPRLTRQYIDGKFYDYPVNAKQVLSNIGPFKAVRIVLDYCVACLVGLVKYKWMKRPVKTFEEFVVANFGRTLAEFSMINYTEKIWGIPATTIHPDWGKQRIKGLNLFSVVQNALSFGGKAKKGGSPKSLVDEFFYPQFGTGRIYEAIAARLQTMGSEIRTQTEPRVIKHDGKRITEVVLKGADGEYSVHPETVVESIPLTRFVTLLDPAPPAEVLEAAQGLRWRAQVYLFLTLNKEQVSPDNWVYYPNADIPFGRTSEMKNFSKDMAPPGKTSFFIEFFTFEGDEIWKMNEDQLVELILPHFEKFGFFTREDIRKAYVIRRPNVYPIYDLEYPGRLDKVKTWLDQLENLIYIGRPGRFRYTNQDHSLEMGITASAMILEGHRRYDLDAIGNENEYFEKGPIYEKRV